MSKGAMRLKKLLRPDLKDQQKLFTIDPKEIPSELHFGFKHLHRYSKHIDGLQIQDIKYNPTVRGFVSHSEKQIRVWQPEKYSEIEVEGKTLFSAKFFDLTGSNSINCLTYWRQYFIYLVASSDFKMHIFNESLHYAGSFSLRTRMVSFIETVDKKSQIITSGIDGCFLYHLNYEGKYQPRQALILDPEANSFDGQLNLIRPFEQSAVWIKGQKFVKDRSLIINWSQDVLTIHYPDGSLLYLYNNLIDSDDCVTDVLLRDEDHSKCFITASTKGFIHVWKYTNSKQLLH